MTNLYSVLPGIQPTADEIQQAELLALQILTTQYPDMDLRQGTGLRDLVLRPNAFMLALVKKGLDYYFAQNTISGMTDDTDEDILDSILSNWFLTRNLGTYAVISARLYFARQKNVTLSSNTYFSPDNTLLYYPQSTSTISSAAMSYDSNQNEYYFDINLQAAAQGTSYNLSSGSLLYFSNFDPYFLHAEINYLVDSSTSGETNTQFISRASTAISTRNLINNPSIVSNLEQTFNYIDRVVPIGMGDPEMVRDQIQAIFNPETPRLLTNLTSTAEMATATLPDHGWFNGQVVTVSGASPSQYNGTYTITVLDTNTFTYTLATTAGVVTAFPTVQSVTSPVLLHNGGMVDVYCDDSMSSEVIQLTTDAAGNATLSGPIYAFSRSSVSGGSAADTIPFQANVTITSSTLNAGSGYISVSAPNHGLTTGTEVTVGGLTQTLTITSLTCNNLVATATITGHGLTTGTSITVSGVSPATYEGTFTITVVDANTVTYTVAANIPTPGSGSSMIATNPNIDGTFPVVVQGTNAFNITTPYIWANATTTGTLTVEYNVPFTFTNTNLQSLSIQSMTCSGTTVTVQIPNHGLTVNRYVTIAGATPSSYNGQWLITDVVNSNQFTFTVPTTIGSAASGTMTATSVIPWYDYGFSTRQEITISFGTGYANGTASFQTSYFTNVASIQTYLSDPTNRVISADLLARGFNFYVLNLGVVGYNGTTPDQNTVQTTAQTFLQSLSAGSVFIVSDLVSALSVAGVTNIQNPPSITYTKYTRDLITPVTGTITDYLDPNDVTNIFVLGTVTTSTATV
jgi:hypothetical protein